MLKHKHVNNDSCTLAWAAHLPDPVSIRVSLHTCTLSFISDIHTIFSVTRWGCANISCLELNIDGGYNITLCRPIIIKHIFTVHTTMVRCKTAVNCLYKLDKNDKVSLHINITSLLCCCYQIALLDAELLFRLTMDLHSCQSIKFI